MVVFPIGSLVASAIKRTMSMMGNSSLQYAERAMISFSIVDRVVSLSLQQLRLPKHRTLCKSDLKSSRL